MCGLCGALGPGIAWEQEGRSCGDARWRTGREAAATAAALTRLFSPVRIRVTAHPSFGFIVAFPTGRTELAAGLAMVWHALDRRQVPIPDPLGFD
jgi:hypothetical protein